MSQDDALWADRLLVDVHGDADPTPEDAARNFASLERRLQLGTSGADGLSRAGDGAAASAGTLLQLRPGSPPPVAAAGRMTSASSGWKSAAVLGRWLAFGATSALLGYLGGRAESRRELAELEQVQQLPPARLEQGLELRPRPPGQPLERARELQVQAPVQPRGEPHGLPPPRPRAAPAPRTALLRNAAPLPPPPQHSPPNQQLREAIELLQRAEATLRKGDAFAASLLLSDLDRTAPAHLLREERLVTRALVSCALADAPAAAAALQDLERLNPESIYRARLEGSCAEKKLERLPKEPRAPH